jgi:hypothetical protein
MLLAGSPHSAGRHFANITIYHVNPHRYGAIPYSMNTGDAVGDLFFDLFQVVIGPLACQNETESRFCSNPEATGADLVVNKLRMEVDTRYSGCECAAALVCPTPAPPADAAPYSYRRRQMQHRRQRDGSARAPLPDRHLLLLLLRRVGRLHHPVQRHCGPSQCVEGTP